MHWLCGLAYYLCVLREFGPKCMVLNMFEHGLSINCQNHKYSHYRYKRDTCDVKSSIAYIEMLLHNWHRSSVFILYLELMLLWYIIVDLVSRSSNCLCCMICWEISLESWVSCYRGNFPQNVLMSYKSFFYLLPQFCWSLFFDNK